MRLSSRAAAATIVVGFAAFAVTLAAIAYRRRLARSREVDEAVDEASMDSFPASDPPAFGGTTRTGSPSR